MKLPSILSSTFTSDAPLRATLKKHKDVEAEAARVDGIKEDTIAHREGIIASHDMENPEALRKAGDCDIKIGMATHKALQLRAMLPALRADVDARTYQLAACLNKASAAARAELQSFVSNLLAPLFDGGDDANVKIRGEHLIKDVTYGSVPESDFHFHSARLSIATREGAEVYTAERLLEDYDRLVRAFRKHARFLPDKFSPFPTSANQLDAEHPLPKSVVERPQPQLSTSDNRIDNRVGNRTGERINELKTESNRTGERINELKTESNRTGERINELKTESNRTGERINELKTESVHPDKHDAELSAEELADIERQHAPVHVE